MPEPQIVAIGGGGDTLEQTWTLFRHVLSLTVTDGGCGMSPRSDSPGLGLGLPLIATLAENVDVRGGPDGTGTEVAMRFSLEASRQRVGQVNDKRRPAH